MRETGIAWVVLGSLEHCNVTTCGATADTWPEFNICNVSDDKNASVDNDVDWELVPRLPLLGHTA